MPKIKCVCAWCGKLIRRDPSAVRSETFCCLAHYFEWMRSPEGTASHPAKKPENRVRNRETSLALWQDPEYASRTTAATLEVVSRPETRAKCSRRTTIHWQDPEYAAKVLENSPVGNRGGNNPSWKGGVSKEPYTEDWFEVRKSIRERDGCTCVVCGGWGNHVHHKDYDKKNNDLANLVTLCKSCHSRTTAGDRDYWRAYLTGVGHELFLGAC